MVWANNRHEIQDKDPEALVSDRIQLKIPRTRQWPKKGMLTSYIIYPLETSRLAMEHHHFQEVQ